MFKIWITDQELRVLATIDETTKQIFFDWTNPQADECSASVGSTVLTCQSFTQASGSTVGSAYVEILITSLPIGL